MFISKKVAEKNKEDGYIQQMKLWQEKVYGGSKQEDMCTVPTKIIPVRADIRCTDLVQWGWPDSEEVSKQA